MLKRAHARIALLAASLLIGAAVVPVSANASATPEMQYACALKSNGQLSYSATNQCGKNYTLVTIKPGPVLVCVQPSGSSRKVSNFRDCKPPAMQLTLPPTSGVVYFCVTISTSVLRYVTDPSQCTSSEFAVQVTPNDAAPTVASTSPTNGATHVATNTNIVVNFSESVTVGSSAFTLVCGGSSKAFAVSGSPGTAITLDPTADIAQGTTCTVTVVANNVSDTDTLDPPDHPAADYTFSFTTDTAPSVTSTTPADGATNVAVSSNVTVNFSEPVHAASSAFTLACGASSQAFGLTGDGTATFVLDPTADLPTTSNCTVTVTASGVSDVDAGDPPDNLAADYSFSFTTVDVAPSVTSTSPTDGATGVSTDTNITVNFSEAVFAADGAFTVSCPASGPVPVFVATASPALTFVVDPLVSLTQGEACTVTVVASKITDADVVDPPDNMAADYGFSFTTDSAPAVTSTDPTNGATGVSPSTAITVNFSEAVDVTTSSFSISCGGSPQAFGVGGSGTSTITVTPTGDLPSTSTCTVTAIAANISDTDLGDPPDHLAADYPFSFTTQDAAPSVASTSPADGATDASPGTNITITFSESVSATGTAFDVECPSGSPVAFSASGSPGTTITLDPTSNLPAGETCTVTVHADQISDTDAVDPPDNMAADYVFSFTVTPNSAPTDIALSPSSVAENQPTATTVGTLTTTDPDAGDTFTYALATGTGDTDNGSFTISGDTVKTNAVFDFETKSSYTIRVRSTDSATNFFEKQFTITITDANDAPTDIALSNSSVDENQPSGTAVGTLSSTDQDAGDSFTYTLVSGTGSTDNASFAISGAGLKTNAMFNFEVKSSYSIRVRTTDSGGQFFEKQFTITINNVNDPPVAAADTYNGAIGNTLAVVGTTASGPNVVLTGNVVTSNDTDEDNPPQTLTAVAETVSSTGGGTANINSDGSFTFLPGVGDKNQNDTFTYHVTDGTATTAGTVTVHIDNFLVWYVDNTSAAVTHDGRSSSPLLGLTGINGAGGLGDSDGTGDTLFVYAGSGSYGGGLPLEANQSLFGQKAGLTVNGKSLVAAGPTAPTITNAAGNGVGLADGVDVEGVAISGTSADGINGTSVATAVVGTTTAVTIGTAGGDGVDLSGSATGNISIAASISGSVGRSVAVSGRTGGTTAFSGAISGGGISLSSNGGATVNFTGGLTISTTSTSAFSATGGGTVNVTNASNTLSSTTGTTLDVENTSIGSSGLKFKSVTTNGAVNGIKLVNTGTAGGLTVTGNGTAVNTGGDDSGGIIGNTTGAGVLLSGTQDVSLTNVSVVNTPNSPGIDGTDVTNFTFNRGKVLTNGGTSHGAFDSNIAFNDNGTTVNNIDGTLTITNSDLENAYQHGVDVLNNSGTLTSVNISNNFISSLQTAADSAGSGIRIQELGSASTAGSISRGTINSNIITDFPNGAGMVLSGGNTTGAAAAGGIFGTGSGADAVAVNGNIIKGASLANPMATNCILVTMAGKGAGFVDVTNNGTGIDPLGFNKGNCISINSAGVYTLTSNVTGNVVKPQSQLSGTFGITGGTDSQILADSTVADSAVLNLTALNNNVSSTTGVGMYFVARGHGTVNARIQNNTVAAPTDAVARSGIRVDSGNSATSDAFVCLQISGNTSAGASDGTNTSPGISLRKQGAVDTVNDFGIVGLTPSPATAAQTESYVAGQNPASASGTFGTGGAAVLSGSPFHACTLPAF